MGRFQPKHDTAVLIAVINDVLRTADPERPDRVTQRVYDETRVALGHAGTPRADKLCERFGVSWSGLRERVLNERDPAYSLAVAGKHQTRRVLTRAEVAAALRRVATRLGTDELTREDYERTRLEMDAEAARRHRHGAHIAPLPSAGTIANRIGWPAAIKAAGLKAPPAPVRSSLPRAEAVGVFVEHYGFVPSQDALDWFARHHRIQLVNDQGVRHTRVVAEAREAFAARGRWFPPPALRPKRPLDWQSLADGAPTLAALAAQYPRRRAAGEAFTLAEHRAAIARAYDALEPGRRLTAAAYRALAKQLDLPRLTSLYETAATHDTNFAQMVRDEAAARAARARSTRTRA